MGAYRCNSSITSSSRIGLYVHIPFCVHKCSYCDFYSVVTLDTMEDFVTALCHEIELRRRDLQRDVTIETIFWGGGTPSILPLPFAEKIAQTIQQHFSVAPDVEWTIEANPGTVTVEKLSFYRQLGINRVSFGVQSFDPDELRFLERIHTADDAIASVEWARTAGFDSINVDLMYALPGQSIESHRRNLEQACLLQPDHISAYSLVYEPGTPLYHRMQRGEVIPQTEDKEAQFYLVTSELLAQRGYEQYEVSNFARPGKRCRHNLLYWRRGEYLGFGPSAHSHCANVRWSNVRSVKRYIETLCAGQYPIAHLEHLTLQQQLEEEIFLRLRAEGIDVHWFEQQYGVSFRVGPLARQWAHLQEEGIAVKSASVFRLTKKGYALCDTVTVELLHLVEHALPQAAETIL
ncbi:MAG: radical SAM family heme chaperone HemW [Candidatus Kapabacteria bacterium]|nr:radical SAM family heme chaperone HemW [Candidatus Kapabacteria bacterium]MCS7301971.1 radical SAM family heme chaperone HemW [Candidatus Kapabacteria bacterium]